MNYFRKITTWPLRDYVESMWLATHYVQPHPNELLLPSGSMTLVVDLSRGGQARIAGASSRYSILDTSKPVSMIAACFKPGKGFVFFAPPAGALENLIVPLDLFVGQAAHDLRDQLLAEHRSEARFGVLERFLLKRLGASGQAHAAVQYAVMQLQGPTHPVSVADVIDKSGLGSRRFIGLFRHQVGMTPKRFQRVMRFNHVLQTVDSAKEIDWSDIAVSRGYFDQAHLVHDFNAFAGMSPTAYLRHRSSVRHVALAAEG